MTTYEIQILTDRLIPVPQELHFQDGPGFQLTNRCRVEVSVPEAIPAIESTFQKYWKVTPEPVLRESRFDHPSPEAYRIEIGENRLQLSANTGAGVANALKTLRQLAENGWLPDCRISDFPALPFRGIHLCIFPETPLWDIEKRLRLAAYHKFNFAVIETWGVFPFKSHPEFCRPGQAPDRRELKKLVELGREIGITLIPQYNLLGHAAGSRACSGKHHVLDFRPELQELFEPAGWTWCLSNPKVRHYLTDLVLELHEFFDSPPYFHIGCDEANDFGTCRLCRKQELKTLLLDHLSYFHDLFKQRQTRLIMWHDMLITQGDPRWEGYTAYGMPEQHLETLYRELPRDILIADWQYRLGPPGVEPHWPSARFFHDAGFPVLVCPWLNEKGIISQGQLAAELNLAGMLETTWHLAYGQNYVSIYNTAAGAAWNPRQTRIQTLATAQSVTSHLRQVGWDVGLTDYQQTGFCRRQTDAGQYPIP